MKKILLTVLPLILLISLLSCNKSSYLDTETSASLAQKAKTALGTDVAYTTAEDGYLDDYFQSPAYVTDSIVFFATEGNNIDEFGIFHVKEGSAKDMKAQLEEYLKKSYEKNQEWYDSYIPEETPKLRDAQVKVFGNYAIYAIASDSDRELFFKTVEDSLKQ